MMYLKDLGFEEHVINSLLEEFFFRGFAFLTLNTAVLLCISKKSQLYFNVANFLQVNPIS